MTASIRWEFASRTFWIAIFSLLNSLHLLSSTSICWYWLFLSFIYAFLASLSFSVSPFVFCYLFRSPTFQWNQLTFFVPSHPLVSHQWHCNFSISINNKFQLCAHSLYFNEIYLLRVPTISTLLFSIKKRNFQIENAFMFSHQRRNCIKATVWPNEKRKHGNNQQLSRLIEIEIWTNYLYVKIIYMLKTISM